MAVTHTLYKIFATDAKTATTMTFAKNATDKCYQGFFLKTD